MSQTTSAAFWLETASGEKLKERPEGFDTLTHFVDTD
jgi:hypothetical protein